MRVCRAHRHFHLPTPLVETFSVFDSQNNLSMSSSQAASASSSTNRPQESRKPQNPVWDFVESLENGVAARHASRIRCRLCACDLSKYRMNSTNLCKKHYWHPENARKSVKCSRFGPTDRAKLMSHFDVEIEAVEGFPTIDTDSSLTVPAKRQKSNSDITQFGIKFDRTDLESRWTRALLTGNVAFEFSENPDIRGIFESLGILNFPPSAYKVSSSLLDQEYEKIMRSMQADIAASSYVALTSDGWTTIRKDSLVAYNVHSIRDVHFWDAWISQTTNHTANNLTKDIVRVVQDLKACNAITDVRSISGFVSDSCRTMVATRQSLERQYPHLSVIGCSAHALNLVVKDVVEYDEDMRLTLNAAAGIVNAVRGSPLMTAHFQSTGTRLSLVLPVITRWGTTVDCVRRLLDCRMHLAQLLAVPDAFRRLPESVRTSLVSDSFWAHCETFVNALAPLTACIFAVESDKATLSDSFVLWENLENYFRELTPPTVLSTLIVSRIQHRRQQFIDCPAFAAAFVLDPRNRRRWNTPQRWTVVEQAKQVFDKVFRLPEEKLAALHEFELYFSGMGPFSNFDWDNCLDLKVLWSGSKSIAVPYLSKVASYVYVIPPTSAACERTFSRVGRVQSKSRAKLSNDKAVRICQISGFYRLLASKDRVRKYATSGQARAQRLSQLRAGVFQDTGTRTPSLDDEADRDRHASILSPEVALVVPSCGSLQEIWSDIGLTCPYVPSADEDEIDEASVNSHSDGSPFD